MAKVISIQSVFYPMTRGCLDQSAFTLYILYAEVGFSLPCLLVEMGWFFVILTVKVIIKERSVAETF